MLFSFSVLKGQKGTSFQQGVKVRKKAEGYSRYDENISKPVELAPYGLGIQMEQMHTDLNQPLIRINS